MLTRSPWIASVLSSLTLGACSSTPEAAPAQTRYGVGAPAQLFEDLGPHTRSVTTSSVEAQRYFDQGLNWAYAFNHDEAVRSFERAAELDPDCAMAWWGAALCQGPNYNDPEMTPGRARAAWDALQQALAKLEGTTAVERALIEALAERYALPEPRDRSALDLAYADAMGEVYADFPNDSDVGTLYAEAVMVLTPWDLYDENLAPRERTEEIVLVLERVMELDPENPGANHLHIHAVEPSAKPDRGVPSANRLSDLVPSAGHLEHMPSHIYVQVGMWNEAVVQNQKALAADTTYRELSPEQGIQHMYMTHNAHMLAYASMMSGREEQALAAARAMWANIPPEVLEGVAPYLDQWMCAVYDVQKRFGLWDELLAEPAPPDFLPLTTASWRAARAVALAAKKEFAAARAEQELFRAAVAALPEDATWGSSDPAATALLAGEHFVEAEIALQQRDWATAAAELEQGAAAEDLLSYGEPPIWMQPIRHTLGAVYLADERFEDAERVYLEDLAKWRNNGWSLYGLSRALEGQGRTEEAAAVRAEYELAWENADAPIESSCLCIPKT